ncbi:MAG: hypothetical protein WCL30_05335 [Pseudomonadota bacterium]
MKKSFVCLLTVAVILTACGVKRPLVLPKDSPDQKQSQEQKQEGK